jgi:hypothetical protein
VVDLLKMKAIIWDMSKTKGTTFTYGDIPAASRGRGQRRRASSWSKPLPKSSEDLMNKYLE